MDSSWDGNASFINSLFSQENIFESDAFYRARTFILLSLMIIDRSKLFIMSVDTEKRLRLLFPFSSYLSSLRGIRKMSNVSSFPFFRQICSLPAEGTGHQLTFEWVLVKEAYNNDDNNNYRV